MDTYLPNYNWIISHDKHCDLNKLKHLLTGLFKIPSCNVNKASLVNRDAKRNCISSAVWLSRNIKKNYHLYNIYSVTA